MNINKSNKFLFFLYNRSLSTPEHADKLLYRANVGYSLTLFKVTCKTCITIFNPSAKENDNFPFFSKKILFKNALIWTEKKHRFFYYIIWSELFISANSVVKLLHSERGWWSLTCVHGQNKDFEERLAKLDLCLCSDKSKILKRLLK